VDDFPIYRDEDRQLYLSYWYERLSRHLLHMKPIPLDQWFAEKGLSHYDIDAEQLNAYVEVKGASNNDRLKLFEDQLDAQLGELGFPVDDGFVWIFGYRNRESTGGRDRLLKRGSGKSWESLSAFLAKSTNVAYIIDVRLLALLREQNGTSSYDRDPFNVRNLVRLNRTELKHLAEDERGGLEKLGVPSGDLSRWLPPNAKRSRSRIIETAFDGRSVSFRLVVLTPNGFKNRFLRQLNGNVKMVA
jgi:hypothetical protein